MAASLGWDACSWPALREGWIDGPDLLISLRQVCTTGGIGDHWATRLGDVDGFGARSSTANGPTSSSSTEPDST